MHNLPLEALLLACCVFVILLTRKEARSFIKDLFSVVEDRWTWTTQTGEIYEDAEIEQLDDEQLVLKHRLGVTRLPIETLSQESYNLLVHTREWRDHAPSVSAVGKTSAAFKSQSLHASHAA